MFRKKFWITVGIVLPLIAALLAWQSAVTGPRFFVEAIKTPAELHQAEGDQLEEILLEAHNDAVRQDQWTCRITDKQLTGWLRHTGRKKYHALNNPNILAPTIDFEENSVSAAFRLNSSWFPAVIHVRIEPLVSADENSIGFRLRAVNAGWIPLPRQRVIDRINAGISKSKIPIAWTTDQGAPTALLPARIEMEKKLRRAIHVTGIEVADGVMTISGTAVDTD